MAATPQEIYTLIEQDNAEKLRPLLQDNLGITIWRDFPRAVNDPLYGVHRDQTALHLACLLGKKKVAELLINFGASTTMRDRSGRNPLAMAVASDHTASAGHIIQLLLARGADPNIPPRLPSNPQEQLSLPHSAVEQAVEYLVKHYDRSGQRNTNKLVALLNGGARGDIPSARGLLPAEIMLANYPKYLGPLAMSGLDLTFLFAREDNDPEWWRAAKLAKDNGKAVSFPVEAMKELRVERDELRERLFESLLHDARLKHPQDVWLGHHDARLLRCFGLLPDLFAPSRWQGRSREALALLRDIESRLPPSLPRDETEMLLLRGLNAPDSLAERIAMRHSRSAQKERDVG